MTFGLSVLKIALADPLSPLPPFPPKTQMGERGELAVKGNLHASEGVQIPLFPSKMSCHN